MKREYFKLVKTEDGAFRELLRYDEKGGKVKPRGEKRFGIALGDLRVITWDEALGNVWMASLGKDKVKYEGYVDELFLKDSKL